MSHPRVPREQHQFAFDADTEASLRIEPGTTVVVETLDCFSNKVTSPQQVFDSDSDVLALVGRYNPVSRPIHVMGAEPGDTLTVRIDQIDLGVVEPYAVTLVTRDSALLAGRSTPHLGRDSDTKICPIADGYVVLPTGSGALRHPIRPMIGAIGTAPQGSVSSLHYGPTHAGNIDCPEVTVGATVYLPVNVPGGLLSLGDLHALMGDGEITGIALETHGDVTITVDLIQAANDPARLSTPRLDTATAIGCIGCGSEQSVDANIASAVEDMLTRLRAEYDLSPLDAYELFGATGRIRVNQCVYHSGRGWCTTLASIDRATLPGGALWRTGTAYAAEPAPDALR